MKFFAYGWISYDRSGDELREHAYVGHESKKIMFRLNFISVDVYAVAHGLESEEADTYRKSDTRKIEVHMENGIDALNGKIGVFKEAEHAQINDDRYDKEDVLKTFPVSEFLYKESVAVVHNGRKYHKQDIYRFTPCIEEQAEDQKNKILKSERNRKIEQHKCGKKKEQK